MHGTVSTGAARSPSASPPSPFHAAPESCASGSIISIVTALLAREPEVRVVDELRDTLADIRRVRAWLDHLESRVVSALDSCPTVMPAIELVRTGMRASDVRRVIARADTVSTTPVFADALSAGRVTSAHVDALTGALALMGPHGDRLLDAAPALVSEAERLSPDDFARRVRATARTLLSDGGVDVLTTQRRQTCLRSWIDDEGMTVLHGRFDPERGAVITTLLDRAVEAVFHTGSHSDEVDVAAGVQPNDHRRALALMTMLQRAGDLPVDTIRRLACDADIIPVVLNSHGVPLDVGRSNRLATVHQRRALAARYRTCAAPHCTVAVHRCAPHHMRPWQEGGTTDLHNLVPLCSRHHHAVHEGGWSLVVDTETGDVEFTPPSIV